MLSSLTSFSVRRRRTARVITAAAAIMTGVFGSFVLGDLRAIGLIGLGLAVAVLVDATVVRMLLVPATMELPGDHDRWLQRRLRRVLPCVDIDVDVEGRRHDAIAPGTTPERELAEVR
ncbi:unannotated protein [freshwater metagenome]|uniref:Unannotated protein n=1 Tax=freshwater metagenome TaxID=449393 RepID=A0A6J6BKF1_9ZZZZ